MLTALSVPIVKLSGARGTLLVLTLNNLPPPFSFFGSPKGMPPKKEKKQGVGRSTMFTSKGKEVFRPDDKGHSAKQKTQAIYPDILLVLILSWQRFRLCLYLLFYLKTAIFIYMWDV